LNKGFFLLVSGNTKRFYPHFQNVSVLSPHSLFTTFFCFLNNRESHCSFAQRWKLCKGNSLQKCTSKAQLGCCLFYGRNGNAVLATGVRNFTVQNLHRTERPALLNGRQLGDCCSARRAYDLQPPRDWLCRRTGLHDSHAAQRESQRQQELTQRQKQPVLNGRALATPSSHSYSGLCQLTAVPA